MNTSLSRLLDDDSALSYRWTSTYNTEPTSRWTRTALSVRFRQQFWREWFFVELIPELVWEEEHDWETNPGIRIVLEALLTDDL